MSEGNGRFGEGIDRRRFIQRAGGVGALAVSGNLLAACGVKKKKDTASTGGGGGAKKGNPVLRIGLVTPQTGEASGFGEVDPYIVGQVKKATANGITAGDGKTYDIEIIEKTASPIRRSRRSRPTR